MERIQEYMYSRSLLPLVRNQIGNQSSTQGDRKLKTLKYYCKVFYPVLRSNRDCGWEEYGDKS